MADPNRCPKAPSGYLCTRPLGHEGPCRPQALNTGMIELEELRKLRFLMRQAYDCMEHFGDVPDGVYAEMTAQLETCERWAPPSGYQRRAGRS